MVDMEHGRGTGVSEKTINNLRMAQFEGIPEEYIWDDDHYEGCADWYLVLVYV